MQLVDDSVTSESSRYKCLAEAVIIQAIKDATRETERRRIYKSSGHMYSMPDSAEAAVHFLLKDAEVFEFWCHVAGLIPDEVRNNLNRRLKHKRTYHLIRALHRTRKKDIETKEPQ